MAALYDMLYLLPFDQLTPNFTRPLPHLVMLESKNHNAHIDFVYF